MATVLKVHASVALVAQGIKWRKQNQNSSANLVGISHPNIWVVVLIVAHGILLSKKLKQKRSKCARDPDWGKTRPVKLGEVESLATPRVLTNMGEFNRVLGGGVVPGSLILIGGDPGIGKSTILYKCQCSWLILGVFFMFQVRNQPNKSKCVQNV